VRRSVAPSVQRRTYVLWSTLSVRATGFSSLSPALPAPAACVRDLRVGLFFFKVAVSKPHCTRIYVNAYHSFVPGN
jgi:hypothetical protein